MKKSTEVALFWAAVLATSSLINLNEWSGVVAAMLVAGAYIFDASFRRLFDV